MNQAGFDTFVRGASHEIRLIVNDSLGGNPCRVSEDSQHEDVLLSLGRGILYESSICYARNSLLSKEGRGENFPEFSGTKLRLKN